MVTRVLASNGGLPSRSTEEEARTLSRLYACRAREVWTWCLQRTKSRRERSSGQEKGEQVAGRAVDEGSDSHNVGRNLSRDSPRLVIVIASLLIFVSHLGCSWGQTRQAASRNRTNGLLESTSLRPACHVGLSPLGHFSSPCSSTSGM